MNGGHATHDRLKAVVRVNGGVGWGGVEVDTLNSCFEYGICLICCHALLSMASLCVLRTCVHFAECYRSPVTKSKSNK